MRRRTKAAIILAAVALFVFFVPVVPISFNDCPPGAFCLIFTGSATASISYYETGVGGRLMTTNSWQAYQILFWPGWICHPSTTQQGGLDCYQIIWSSS